VQDWRTTVAPLALEEAVKHFPLLRTGSIRTGESWGGVCALTSNTAREAASTREEKLNMMD